MESLYCFAYMAKNLEITVSVSRGHVSGNLKMKSSYNEIRLLAHRSYPHFWHPLAIPLFQTPYHFPQALMWVPVPDLSKVLTRY